MQQNKRYPKWYTRTRRVLIALGFAAFPAGYAVELLRPTLPQLLVTFLIPFAGMLCVVVLIGVAEVFFALGRQPGPPGGGPAAA